MFSDATRTRLLCRMTAALILATLVTWGPVGNNSAPAQVPTCTQPADSDIAMTFCDAAHDEIAAQYAEPLLNVSTDGYVPPIILKAIGGAETGWLQCYSDGAPVSSPDGCAWGLMQIHSGMDCSLPSEQFNAETQQQVRYDYRYNIAMGAYQLRLWKWDWHQSAGRTIGDGSAEVAEHWYYAVWAYNRWDVRNSPGNLERNPCRDWPVRPEDCAYQDVVWWWAAHPVERGGRPLWSPVDLTRPNPSLFPSTQAEMDAWADWHIPDPEPVHRDSCRNCLPLVLNRWPPLPYEPVLNPIDNPGGASSYTVSWAAADLADTYVLEEAGDAGFTAPVTRYTGPNLSWAAAGKPAGTYYYRVRGRNSWGDGGWSNVESTTVLPPPGWQTVVSEGFEGAFPGAWVVWDGNGASYGEYYWKDHTCRASAGAWSGWAVGGHPQRWPGLREHLPGQCRQLDGLRPVQLGGRHSRRAGPQALGEQRTEL